MGLHKSFDRTFILNAGAIKTSGGSLDLAKGQFGIFSQKNADSTGLPAMAAFDNLPRSSKFVMRLGTVNLPVTRSQTDKAYSSFPFALADVEEITVDAPTDTEQQVDELIVGYDGIDASTALTFLKGETQKLFIKLSGERIGMMGYPSANVVVSVYLDENDCITTDCVTCDSCDDADPRPIVFDAIAKLKDITLRGMVPLTDLVEITPVMECDSVISPTETNEVFYTLTVCDTGDARALALIQAQYPDDEVVRLSRSGANSTYQVRVSTGAPDDYTTSVASLIKGCEDCPADYTAVDGGLLYAITVVDDGADVSSSVIETLNYAVTGTAIKSGGENGVGFYTVVLTDIPSAANVTTFITANPTATVEYIDTVDAVCTPDSEPTTAWVVGDTCTVTTEDYEIVLPDDKCGNNRLAEIQKAYPYNTVVVASSSDVHEQAIVTLTVGTSGTAEITIGGVAYTVTWNTDAATTAADFITTEAATILATELSTATVYSDGSETTTIAVTGTSGTATVTIDGTDYLVTFDTNLTDTADNFVTAFAATILAAHDVVVTAATGTLTFVYADSLSAPTIANTSGDLDGTEFTQARISIVYPEADTAPTIANATGDLDGTEINQGAPVVGGCSTKYNISVATNTICDECDDIFKDIYTSGLPAQYDQHSWVLVDPALYDGLTNCLMGIRLKGKVFEVHADDSLRDNIGFIDNSVKIEANGGYITEIASRDGIGEITDKSFHTYYKSRWIERNNMGGRFYDQEDRARKYFTGDERAIGGGDEYFSRILKGQTTDLIANAQYVDYAVTVSRKNRSQSFSGNLVESSTFHILVEVGHHADVEALLNSLAGAAGIDGVKAYGA